MISIKKTKDNLVSLYALKELMESYEEIAAARVRKIKLSVLQNRQYLEGINDIFAYVNSAYAMYLANVKKSTVSPRKTNGKTVLVFLSSQIGLYGDLIQKIFELFLEDSVDRTFDLVVIGRYGKYMYENSHDPRKFEFFDMPEGGALDKRIKAIMDYIIEYEKIIIYHGMFENVLTQKATKSMLTGDISTFTSKKSNKDTYGELAIFEPSVKEVVGFFQNQILGVLFEQSLNESNLSRYSSRMINLDYAVARTSKELSNMSQKIVKLKHKKADVMQMSVLAGVNLWK